jgi:hypothetical protein
MPRSPASQAPILQGNEVGDVTATAGIHLKAFGWGTKLYILAVNGDNGEVNAQISGKALKRIFDVLNEGRKVDGSSGTISDKFGPLATHIYVGE